MSTSASFLLSARGLANIPQHERRNDFEFIVGSSRARYRCPSFVVDFLSPLICDLHSTDETISAFEIRTKDEDFKFGDFLSLGLGTQLSAPSCFRLAKNCGTLRVHLPHFRGDASIANVVDRLSSHGRIGDDSSAELEFVASHFFEISDFSDLSLEVFREVVCHRCL
jgi:hypothetical protein